MMNRFGRIAAASVARRMVSRPVSSSSGVLATLRLPSVQEISSSAGRRFAITSVRSFAGDAAHHAPARDEVFCFNQSVVLCCIYSVHIIAIFIYTIVTIHISK